MERITRYLVTRILSGPLRPGEYRRVRVGNSNRWTARIACPSCGLESDVDEKWILPKTADLNHKLKCQGCPFEGHVRLADWELYL